jgi:hypothetical protein
MHLPRTRWIFERIYGRQGIAVQFRAARVLPTPGALLWELGALAVTARQVRAELERHGVGDAIPVVLGGIVPESDVEPLRQLGVRAVFTPKDYDLMDVMDRILDVIGAPQGEATSRAASA